MPSPNDAHETGRNEPADTSADGGATRSHTGGIEQVETKIGDDTVEEGKEKLDLEGRDPYSITEEDLQDLTPEKRAALEQVLAAGDDPLEDEVGDITDIDRPNTANQGFDETENRVAQLIENAKYVTMQRVAGQLVDVNGNGKKEELRDALHQADPGLVEAAFESIATDASGKSIQSDSSNGAQNVGEAKERYMRGETDEEGLERDLDNTVPDQVEYEYNDTLTTEDEDEDDVGPYTGGDDGPDPGTITETGLLNDDDEFPWEEESISETEVGEQQVLEFTYAGAPIEIREPEDRQKLENARGIIEGAINADDRGRQQILDRYFDRLVDLCLTIDGHPHREVYVVENPNTGKKSLVHEDTAARYGMQLASMPTATQFWEACTSFKRQQLGRRIDRFTTGEEQFRPRIS